MEFCVRYHSICTQSFDVDRTNGKKGVCPCAYVALESTLELCIWGEFRSNMRANAPVASSVKSIIASATVISQQINVWLADAENLEPYRYMRRENASARVRH